jgi:hypothetical protein
MDSHVQQTSLRLPINSKVMYGSLALLQAFHEVGFAPPEETAFEEWDLAVNMEVATWSANQVRGLNGQAGSVWNDQAWTNNLETGGKSYRGMGWDGMGWDGKVW